MPSMPISERQSWIPTIPTSRQGCNCCDTVEQTDKRLVKPLPRLMCIPSHIKHPALQDHNGLVLVHLAGQHRNHRVDLQCLSMAAGVAWQMSMPLRPSLLTHMSGTIDHRCVPPAHGCNSCGPTRIQSATVVHQFTGVRLLCHPRSMRHLLCLPSLSKEHRRRHPKGRHIA
jgi:hypothetical protein